jgi:superfamily II DNA or RNA helicase
MSISARPYQLESITSLHEGWKDPAIKHQLICMATGTGKTVVFSVFAKHVADTGGRVLILAHTDELIDQAIKKFYAATGMRAGREKAGSYAGRYDKVVVGSVQSLQGDLRLSSWPKNHFNYVVVDEAHRSLAAGYQKVLKHFVAGGAKVVGVTATADRGDKRALGEFYQRVAYDYGLLKAVRDGWLVRPIVKTMPISIDLRGVSSKTYAEGSDLNRDQVSHRLAPFMDAIAEAIKAEIAKEKLLVFLPSVEMAQIMSRALTTAGVSSDWVCGDKKICPDRTERVARHQRNEFQALCNMAVLTEGYDDDQIKNVVCLRATKIRSLYCQIIGRGTRPIGNIVPKLNAAANAFERIKIISESEKPHVRVLDFLWLYEKHDLCTPASLVTQDERVKQLMEGKDGDLIAAEEQAERDLLKKLEDEVRKNRMKESRVVDPLGLAAELGDVELANYEAKTESEARDVSPQQAHILRSNGVNLATVKNHGHAHALINRILARHKRGLATLRQLNFFKKIGIDASEWSKEEASQKQKEKIAEWNARRAEKKQAAEGMAAEIQEVALELNLDLEATPVGRRVESLLADANEVNPFDPNADIEDLSELFAPIPAEVAHV